MKMLLLLVGFTGSALLSLAATSHAAPLGNGFRGGSFQGRLVVHNSGHVFRMGRGVSRGFPFRRDRRFFSRQVIWPVYWYPYFDSGYYPWDDSYLDNGSNYGYWDNSAASVQPQYIRPSATPAPVVIVITKAIPGQPMPLTLSTPMAIRGRSLQKLNKESSCRNQAPNWHRALIQ